MQTEAKTMDKLAVEAADLADRYTYTYDDAVSALSRSLKYYTDIGEDEESAWENAKLMVAEAALMAPEEDFESLRDMVDYMLFSIHHRVRERRF